MRLLRKRIPIIMESLFIYILDLEGKRNYSAPLFIYSGMVSPPIQVLDPTLFLCFFNLG